MTEPLDDALAMFRAEHDRERGDPAAARRRLLRAAHARDVRRGWAKLGALALVIVATNSTTWAWSTGRLDALLEPAPDVTHDALAATKPPAPKPAALASAEPMLAQVAPTPTHQTPTQAEPSADPAPTLADPPAADPTHPPERDARRTALPRVATPHDEPEAETELARALAELAPPETAVPEQPAASETAPPETSEPDPERVAFEAAHRAHHGGAPPERALTEWSAFLTRFPSGRFEPEARWNRAILLVRLRRDDEARAALTPFAEGAHHGVRARDARALLTAMDRGTLRR